MKTIITTILLSLALAMVAHADGVQVDVSITKTQNFLEENKLALIKGAGGAHDDLTAFSQDSIMFYGEAAGNPAHKTLAQRGINAKRAAVTIAQRALTEYLEGIVIVGATLVKDSIMQNDVIVSTVTGFVKGSQVVHQEYNEDTDIATAVIKVAIRGPKGFASTFYEKLSTDPVLKKAVKTDKKPFLAPEVKLDVAFDGLIIDATEQNFRPALINRIFATKGDVLYDPAKISQKVLVEQGCGEYTNSVDKAKAALGTRGVKNPLIIKASGATNPADLQVTDDDAVTIYSADQKGSFMAAAKVAFVLK